VDRRPNRLIIAQYSAPKELSLVAAAELLGEGRRAMAAQIIDFAVRRVITVSRPAKASRKSGFTLTVNRDATGEGPDELDVLHGMYGIRGVTIGRPLTVRPKQNRELGQRLRDPHRRAVARLITRGLAREKNLFTKLFRPWRKQPVVPTAAAEPIIDHLWGIRDYIALAERDRFAMLQTPEGAQRNALDIYLLNEKLLPYAVLFGLEKEWARQLDVQVGQLPADLSALSSAIDILGTTLEVADGVLQIASLIDDVPDVAALGDVLEGVGAVFGGIGEFLGSLSP
jgi:hypothetical protein